VSTLRCLACGHENLDTARFCGACPAPLGKATACPGCGAANPPGQKFCDACARPLVEIPTERKPGVYTPRHLAEKILSSRTALEGERKQVTVLFADVKSSMEIAQSLDPEEWHHILDRFFQILAEGVHRFEGTVNQYTGDGIMALFGPPIAREDHAQRVCYAALHLSETLRHYTIELRLSRGLSFSVRIGLNSGEVVVGKIGDDPRMDYTAPSGVQIRARSAK
jgi:class 3 adenylate cyclase